MSDAFWGGLVLAGIGGMIGGSDLAVAGFFFGSGIVLLMSSLVREGE